MLATSTMKATVATFMSLLFVISAGAHPLAPWWHHSPHWEDSFWRRNQAADNVAECSDAGCVSSATVVAPSSPGGAAHALGPHRPRKVSQATANGFWNAGPQGATGGKTGWSADGGVGGTKLSLLEAVYSKGFKDGLKAGRDQYVQYENTPWDSEIPNTTGPRTGALLASLLRKPFHSKGSRTGALLAALVGKRGGGKHSKIKGGKHRGGKHTGGKFGGKLEAVKGSIFGDDFDGGAHGEAALEGDALDGYSLGGYSLGGGGGADVVSASVEGAQAGGAHGDGAFGGGVLTSGASDDGAHDSSHGEESYAGGSFSAGTHGGGAYGGGALGGGAHGGGAHGGGSIGSGSLGSVGGGVFGSGSHASGVPDDSAHGSEIYGEGRYGGGLYGGGLYGVGSYGGGAYSGGVYSSGAHRGDEHSGGSLGSSVLAGPANEYYILSSDYGIGTSGYANGHDSNNNVDYTYLNQILNNMHPISKLNDQTIVYAFDEADTRPIAVLRPGNAYAMGHVSRPKLSRTKFVPVGIQSVSV